MIPMDRRKFLHFAAASAGAVAAAALPDSIRKALAVEATSTTGTIDDVQHVVILMQENRSFDHYFGTLRGVRGFADRHPVPALHGENVWSQKGGDGRLISPFHLDTHSSNVRNVGGPHLWPDAQGACNGGRWDRWIPNKGELTMGHFRREDIPFQFILADAFTICDAYHCSIHSSTSPNRIFLMSGSNDPRSTGGGPVINHLGSSNLEKYRDYAFWQEFKAGYEAEGEKLTQEQLEAFMQSYSLPKYTYTTYPERLEKAGISWKLYQDPRDNYDGQVNGLVSFAQYWSQPEDSPLWIKGMSKWSLDDLRREVMAGTLPQVSWIVPSAKQSEHPGASSPIEGAAYTQQVLDALTANPEVWSKTVLFLMYDENDCFFDHMPSPAPPGFNPDGSRAGLSTVDTDDEIYTKENLPYGLGPRVPMYVISPWSKGGWVNSEVFDHTSIIRFLEKRYKVMEPNISAWRRAVCGDLTGAFDFTRPVAAALPALPDVSRAKTIMDAHSSFPLPSPPSNPEKLFQEPGIRPSRPLPYDLSVDAARSADGQVLLSFNNSGQAAAVFHVYDRLHLDRIPRRYTVEPGRALTDRWHTAADSGQYDLWVMAPNGFLREFKGDLTQPPIVEVTARPNHKKEGITLMAFNQGRSVCTLTVSANAYLTDGPWIVRLQPGARTRRSWPCVRSGHWYDLTVTGQGLHRRFAGRIESGKLGTSDPAMATA